MGCREALFWFPIKTYGILSSRNQSWTGKNDRSGIYSRKFSKLSSELFENVMVRFKKAYRLYHSRSKTVNLTKIRNFKCTIGFKAQIKSKNQVLRFSTWLWIFTCRTLNIINDRSQILGIVISCPLPIYTGCFSSQK